MSDFVEKELMRKIVVNLGKIAEELKRQNELKEIEIEMRKFWIDRKVAEWKNERML